MKSIRILIFGILFLSCNDEKKPDLTGTDSVTTRRALNYPFTASYSLQGVPGDEKNALLLLNCLKKYVEGDIKGSVAYFADTYFPDRKDTWVTLWYTEIITDKKGKTDSISYVDDVLVRNSQIAEYDEKQRRFPDHSSVK